MNTRKRSQKGNEVGTDSIEIPSDSISNGKLLENFESSYLLKKSGCFVEY